MKLRKIKVKGLTPHAKNRIGNYSEDGNFFIKRDLREEERSTVAQHGRILLESIEPNFKIGEGKFIRWGGWFEIGTEIEILEEETSTECM